mmetsp:Transcript_29370/g.86841  ORF Transcript_29370/g.86841 Transcript_29370/m.86841 type:complete len:202 (+) Transcript_29370:2499-3104(+)
MDEDEDESSGADKRPWSGGDDAASGSSDDSYGLGDRKVAQIMRDRLRRAEAMHHQTKPVNKSETAHTLLSLRHLGSMGGAAHAKPSGNTSAYLDGMPPGTVLRGRSGYEPPTASMPPLIGQPAQFHGVIASPPMVESMHACVTPMQGLVGWPACHATSSQPQSLGAMASMSASMATPMLANEPPMHGRAGGNLDGSSRTWH